MSLVQSHHQRTHILYDRTRLARPDCASLPSPLSRWLEPDAWRERGLVVGEAPGRGATQFLDIQGRRWVLRPYLRGGLAARISHADYLWLGLERTRAFREMRLTQALFDKGLPVPAPVAAIVHHGGPRYRAALITERLPRSEALADRLRDAPEPLLEQVGATIARFHRAGLDHVDLNARNLLISDDDKVWLIDFDRCRLRRPGRWQQDNLSRLKRSLVKLSADNAESSHAAILRGYQQTVLARSS
ncbi:3-deoxy-D-manno-octulosonic acid kinase [Salinicola rhizosphaerae]|uniref:3-deoxy-D-manno-octulosonic acid kinase n=1 Tax=Salinicola rhizosphaerae TaxID=1443141 RepID=A0ABQ3DTJ5_9GAMM|nr:3-deoxy-D-manno-octulosonic acid kinase [Salinicola rhizosphaerae]GHB14420.1 3-deoxy-D-manno-octulosonic acid kinase [Salinicola rhizosphaerae]